MSEKLNIIDVFILGSVFCCVMASLVLWKKSVLTHFIANKILAIFFFFLGYSLFSYILITTGWIEIVPLLYRTSAPLNYIMFPLCYIYIRIILNDERHFNKKDLYLLIPFVLSVLELLPFYIINLEEKKNIVSLILKDPRQLYIRKDGLITGGVHYIIRSIHNFIYLIIIWRAIFRNFIKLSHASKPYYFKQIREVEKWMIALTSWMTLVFLSTLSLIFIVANNINFSLSGKPVEISAIILSFSLLSLSVHIFFYPQVLYGIPQFAIQVNENLSKKNIEKYDAIIESYNWDLLNDIVKLEMLYKDPNLNIQSLSEKLKIKSHELSFLINYHSKLNFQNYISKYRLEHAVRLLNNNAQSSYTIEAIGAESGFGSKSSFFTLFKKHYGCTPMEFVNKKMNY